MKGKLILIVAPSGSGKGTLLKHVLESFPSVSYYVSHTTREPREGEVDGVNYHFVSREEFERLIKEDRFFEWAEYAGNYYGISKGILLSALTEGRVLVTDMEIQGVRQVQERLPRENVETIFIDAGGWEALKNRIEKRSTMSEDELAERHERYLKEVLFKEQADHVVSNCDGELEGARRAIEDIIQGILKSV